MSILVAALILVPQEPSFDAIDYAKPDRYLALHDTFGEAGRVKALAAPLKKRTDLETLRSIGQWISGTLKENNAKAYAWRNVEAVVKDGEYGGCADHALVYGALARACGIPAVWVKTMDADWIREFRADPDGFQGSWRGHVFLEVFLDGKWRLLDAQAQRIYDDYDPKARVFPGERWAYDKGGEPYALILSVRWEEWKKQTRAHFRAFDLKSLPVGGGRPLIRAVHVVGHQPQRIHALAVEQGFEPGMSFNRNFEKWMPRVGGDVLVVTCVGADFQLAEKYRESHSPLSAGQIQDALKKSAHGSARRTLSDGTRVILLYGRVLDDLKAEIESLKID